MQARHLDRRRYFMEEAATTEKYFIPYLSRFIATSGVRVLEVGCGEGGNLLPFARRACRVTGVDMSELRIRQAQTYFREEGAAAELVCCDILDYDCRGRSFDLIIMHDVADAFRRPSADSPQPVAVAHAVCPSPASCRLWASAQVLWRRRLHRRRTDVNKADALHGRGFQPYCGAGGVCRGRHAAVDDKSSLRNQVWPQADGAALAAAHAAVCQKLSFLVVFLCAAPQLTPLPALGAGSERGAFKDIAPLRLPQHSAQRQFVRVEVGLYADGSLVGILP